MNKKLIVIGTVNQIDARIKVNFDMILICHNLSFLIKIKFIFESLNQSLSDNDNYDIEDDL